MDSFMKQSPIHYFFYVLILIIPLLAGYRACQITNPRIHSQDTNLIVLPGHGHVKADIVFNPKENDNRGAFIFSQGSGALRMKEPGQDWQPIHANQALLDRSFIDFGKTIFQYKEYPSSYHWTTFCRIPISNLGIENRAAPISISFAPKNRDDRIVLPQSTMQDHLHALLKDIHVPQSDQIITILSNHFKAISQTLDHRLTTLDTQNHTEQSMPQPITHQSHNTHSSTISPQNSRYSDSNTAIARYRLILVNDLIARFDTPFQKTWRQSTPEERYQLLDQTLINTIVQKKQDIMNRLILGLPASLKTMLAQDRPTLAQAKEFRQWIKTHRSKTIGIQVRMVTIEDTFLILDMLYALAKNHVSYWVLYDRYKWSVLDRLTPAVSKSVKLVRQWIITQSMLPSLALAFTDQDKQKVIQQILYQPDMINKDILSKDHHLSIAQWMTHHALKTGQIAHILPPIEYGVFLSTVDKGWRIIPLVPDTFSIQRITSNATIQDIPLSILEPVTLYNGDIIQIQNLNIMFHLKLTPQTATRQLDQSDLKKLGLKDPGTRTIIHENTGQFYLSLILKSLDKNPTLEPIVKARLEIVSLNLDPEPESEHHAWDLSKYQRNQLRSKDALYGLFHPSGPIPETYTIPLYSDILNQIQDCGLLRQKNGFFYLPSATLFQQVQNQKEQIGETDHGLTEDLFHLISQAEPSTVKTWLALIKKANQTPAVMGAIREANLAFRPAGFSCYANLNGLHMTSDPSWEWLDGNSWQGASHRQDLCPLYVHEKNHWIWDMYPWHPENLSSVTRVFRKQFNMSNPLSMISCDLSLIACGSIQLILNDTPIALHSDDNPEMPVKKWRLQNPGKFMAALKQNNTLMISITNSPAKRTQTNHVGLQVMVSSMNQPNKPVFTTNAHWESSAGYHFQWQQANQDHAWDNVVTHAQYLTPNPVLQSVPVIWSPETYQWKFYSSNQCRRYFRYPFSWPGGDARIWIQSKDSVEVYINGTAYPVINNSVTIPKNQLNAHQNIIAIAVNHQFYQPLSQHISPSLYIHSQTGRLCMGTYSYKQNNPYHSQNTQYLRGEIVDRDKQSLPKLRLIGGEDRLLRLGDEIPLARALNQKKNYIKDMLFIPLVDVYTPQKPIDLFKLPCQTGNYTIQWNHDSRQIGINKQGGNGKIPGTGSYYKLYSVFSHHPFNHAIPWWEPENPSKFNDQTPIGVNITDKQVKELIYDRVQIPLNPLQSKSLLYSLFKSPDMASEQPAIDQKGINPQFKMGELLLFDQSHHIYHAFEIDSYHQFTKSLEIKTNSSQPVNNSEGIQKEASQTEDHANLLANAQYLYTIPAIRIIRHSKGQIHLLPIGPFSNGQLRCNGQDISTAGMTLKNGDHIQINSYVFEYVSNEKGLLAGNVMMNGKPGRYYPPGLGLSHTVGVYFPEFQNGLERVMDSVLSGKWQVDAQKRPPNIQLTLDDDLCRIIKDEVNRQLGIIDRRYAYHIQSLQTLYQGAETPVQKEFYDQQLTNIHKSRQRLGMVVVLNEEGEIVAAVSEPSFESNPEILRHMRSQLSPYSQDPLINRCLHDPRFRPGSSFKLVTAMAGFQYGHQEPFQQAMQLMEKGWFFNNTINLNETSIYQTPIIVDLENHKRHSMPYGTNFNQALRSSYNVWFAYLGLLLNRTVLTRPYFSPGDNFHAYVSPNARRSDFPLLEQAEKMGFNQILTLYRLHYRGNDKNSDKPFERYINRNPDVTDDPLSLAASQFPSQVYDQRSIARMAIGQHSVTETPVMNALISLTLSPKWNGKRPQPVLLKSIFFHNERYPICDTINQLKDASQVCPAFAAEYIRQGMKDVVIKGTGINVFSASPFREFLYGKTGTSERGKAGLFDNSWWTCFVEMPDKKIYAIAACFPDAGEGAHHAADCVKRILDKMWRYYGHAE